ncbi:hypothetical protein T02_6122 [Trichinella nativa]|uniref:Uncharacterized protein n=1 Tax=Trichinella nativa TaxID=6335 RepID=A0A0V1L4Y4_9BILA|nr:hypothetical protein T02_6122 [Trichinella nativa]
MVLLSPYRETRPRFRSKDPGGTTRRPSGRLTTTTPDRLSAHSKQDALHQYDGQAQHVEEPPSKSKIILHGCRLESTQPSSGSLGPVS